MNKSLLIQNGVHLEDHEYQTIKLLLEFGFSIELIPVSLTKGVHTPDIIIDGVFWEMKSPTGGSKNTIKHTMQNAAHQARNIIIDLRRCKLPQETAINEIKYRFQLSKRIIHIMIITKDLKLIDLNSK